MTAHTQLLPTGGCALASLASGNDPTGTATRFDHLFLVQLPPPWEKAALTTPGVPAELKAPLAMLGRAGSIAKALLVDGGAPLPRNGWRIIQYARGRGGPGPNYRGREFIAPPEDLGNLLLALADDPDAESSHEVGVSARDLLVCTHAQRDGCCGVFGEQAFRYIEATHATPSLRVWRTSHFGGHRFAPTLVDLPDGRSWAWLDAPAIDAIVGRTGDPVDLIHKYRGLSSLPGEVQCAERELFAEHGWAWLGADLETDLESSPDGSFIARLSYRLPHGPQVRREFSITAGAGVATPASCGTNARPAVCYRCTPLLAAAV